MQFGNINDYVTDPDLERDGIRLAFGKGRFIDIRRAGGSNTEFLTDMAERVRKHEKEIEDGVLEEEVASKEFIESYARTVVIGWEGWKDAKGKDVPFNVENCVALFQASEEIYSKVRKNAQDLDNFRQEEIKATGNV